MTRTAPDRCVIQSWLRMGRETMFEALSKPLETSIARNVLVIEVGPVPVSTAVVAVAPPLGSLEEFCVGDEHETTAIPRMTVTMPATARKSVPRTLRRSSVWAIAI